MLLCQHTSPACCSLLGFCCVSRTSQTTGNGTLLSFLVSIPCRTALSSLCEFIRIKCFLYVCRWYMASTYTATYFRHMNTVGGSQQLAKHRHHTSPATYTPTPVLHESHFSRASAQVISCCSYDAVCRYGYLDFLKYAWSAQMINQFETSNTRVLEGQTVRSAATSSCTMLTNPFR